MKVLRFSQEIYIWHNAMSFKDSFIDRDNSPIWHLLPDERWVYVALCIATVENPQIPYNEDYIAWRTKSSSCLVKRALKKIILYKLAVVEDVPDIDAGIDTSKKTLRQRKIAALCRKHPLRENIWQLFLEWWHRYPHPPQSPQNPPSEVRMNPNFFIFIRFAVKFRTMTRVKAFLRAVKNYDETKIAPLKRISARQFLRRQKYWKKYRDKPPHWKRRFAETAKQITKKLS